MARSGGYGGCPDSISVTLFLGRGAKEDQAMFESGVVNCPRYLLVFATIGNNLLFSVSIR